MYDVPVSTDVLTDVNFSLDNSLTNELVKAKSRGLATGQAGQAGMTGEGQGTGAGHVG